MVKSTLLHNVTLKQLQKLQNATKVLDSICNPALSLVAVMGSPILTDPQPSRPTLTWRNFATLEKFARLRPFSTV